MRKRSVTTNLKIVTGIIMLFAGVVVIGYFVPRSEFYQVLGSVAVSFGGYALLLQNQKELGLRNLFVIAILVRLALLFATPELSDDVYRFLWDGRISANGGNPYLHLPQNLSDSQLHTFNLDKELLEKLNSPGYYTVYPPLSQYIYAAAAFVGNGNFTLEVIVLRLLLLLAEIVSFVLIVKILKWFDKPAWLLSIYAFNPLVIIELTGNLHFEGVEIMFLLLSFWLCLRNRLWLAGVFFGCAVSVKMLPLMFLPFLFRAIGWKKTFQFSAVVIAVFLVFFIPFYSSTLIMNFWSSLDLYFQRFEFNASIYFLIREAGQMIQGYNIIQTAGPVIAIGVSLVLLVFAFQKKWLNTLLLDRLLFALLLYFLFATVVHPWYVVLLVPFSVFTPWRFPLWWSAAVFLSYAFYHHNEFSISPIWLWIEYGVLVIALLWEGISQHKFNRFIQKV